MNEFNNRAGYTAPRGSGKMFFVVSGLAAVLLAVICALVAVFAFVSPAAESSEKYNGIVSAYEKTDYDYGVYNPIQSQVSEIKEQASVREVFEYYNYDATVSRGSDSFQTDAVFSSNTEGLCISAYNQERLISGEYSLADGEIYVDKVVADALGVGVGDSIELSISKVPAMTFKVKAIFETNTFYDGGSVYFNYSGNNKSQIDAGRTVNLAGILIDAADLSGCYDYLTSYIPYGEMLPRDYFSTDTEYNAYVEDFLSRDYSSQIYSKNAVLESLQTNYENELSGIDSKIMTGAIVCGVVMLLLVLIPVLGIRYEKQYTVRTKTIIPTRTYRIGINVIEIFAYILAFAAVAIGTVSVQSGAAVYESLLSPVLAACGVALLVSCVVAAVVSNVIIGKINNKKY